MKKTISNPKPACWKVCLKVQSHHKVWQISKINKLTELYCGTRILLTRDCGRRHFLPLSKMENENHDEGLNSLVVMMQHMDRK
jgi:hypothetical protein